MSNRERPDVIIEAGHRAAEALDAVGDRKRANDVRRLCKQNASIRGQLKLLNRELRIAKYKARRSWSSEQ